MAVLTFLVAADELSIGSFRSALTGLRLRQIVAGRDTFPVLCRASRSLQELDKLAMLDRMPSELAIRIVEHAAYSFRFSDRQSVVRLAATSRSIYAVATPILYHTLIVGDPQAVRILLFVSDQDTSASARGVFSFVRVLVWSVGNSRYIDPELFISLEAVHALGSQIVDMSQRASTMRSQMSDFRLQRIHTLSIAFSSEIPQFNARVRYGLTHLSGSLPLIYGNHEWRHLHQEPATWMRGILDYLPMLTHLGLELLNIGLPQEHSSMVEMFDLNALETVLLTALAYAKEKLALVALRVTNRYIGQRVEDLNTLFTNVRDPRLRVWWDERLIPSWDHWNEWTNQDVAAGRDIWTEAESVARRPHTTST